MLLDAIVLLGCRIGPGGVPSSTAARRAARAARVWHEGQAPLIVVSGGRLWHGVAETDALARELVRLGVRPDRIVNEWWSLTTAENARHSARLLRELDCVRVGVVTCDWHMPRALSSFRRQGLQVTGLPAQTPPRPLAQRAWRTLRERGAAWLDRAASWGAE